MTAPGDPSGTTTALPRRGLPGSRNGERPTYLSTEFLVFVVLTLGILLAALVVQDNDDHEDYFRADRAWWYITLLGIAFIVSRGLAKTGGRRGE